MKVDDGQAQRQKNLLGACKDVNFVIEYSKAGTDSDNVTAFLNPIPPVSSKNIHFSVILTSELSP